MRILRFLLAAVAFAACARPSEQTAPAAEAPPAPPPKATERCAAPEGSPPPCQQWETALGAPARPGTALSKVEAYQPASPFVAGASVLCSAESGARTEVGTVGDLAYRADFDGGGKIYRAKDLGRPFGALLPRWYWACEVDAMTDRVGCTAWREGVGITLRGPEEWRIRIGEAPVYPGSAIMLRIDDQPPIVDREPAFGPEKSLEIVSAAEQATRIRARYVDIGRSAKSPSARRTRAPT